MSEPFFAEIRIFAGNFAPRGWAFCDGELVFIAQNTALFLLLGTAFGGDGETTFGLPNLQGRFPMHPGNGPGLTPRRLGELGGSSTVTLNSVEMPSHTHTLKASTNSTAGDGESAPVGNVLGRTGNSDPIYGPASNLQAMATQALSGAGSGQAHTNLQPYLAINFIIALEGIFPG